MLKLTMVCPSCTRSPLTRASPAPSSIVSAIPLGSVRPSSGNDVADHVVERHDLLAILAAPAEREQASRQLGTALRLRDDLADIDPRRRGNVVEQQVRIAG